MPSRISSVLAISLATAWLMLLAQESIAFEDDAQLQSGHVLFAVEGTAARVDLFFNAYKSEYDKHDKLWNSCGPANRIYQDASYYVVFVCNPTPAVFPIVNAVYDGVKPPPNSNTELLSMTTTNTLASRNPDCGPKRCKTNTSATCTYYQCPIDPWCYHTGTTYACKGIHKCP